ncbi:MAG: hypothetical protein H0U75_13680 [Legionella sp.]|nr:hypothetical protein [Legionella sp.]
MTIPNTLKNGFKTLADMLMPFFAFRRPYSDKFSLGEIETRRTKIKLVGGIIFNFTSLALYMGVGIAFLPVLIPTMGLGFTILLGCGGMLYLASIGLEVGYQMTKQTLRLYSWFTSTREPDEIHPNNFIPTNPKKYLAVHGDLEEKWETQAVLKKLFDAKKAIKANPEGTGCFGGLSESQMKQKLYINEAVSYLRYDTINSFFEQNPGKEQETYLQSIISSLP